MNAPQRKDRGRIYSGLLLTLVAAVVGVAASALYVSTGGELLGLSAGVFGIQPRADSTTLALRRAREAAWQGRYDEALAAFDTVMGWSPDDRAVALERAKVLAWAHRYAEAADALAAVEDTADAETTLERARFLWWAGRPREADSLLSVLIARNPGAREARELQDLVRPSVEPAVSVASRWVEERPTDPFSHLWLARALVQEGRGAEALSHYRAAFGEPGTAEPEVLLEAAGVALGSDSLHFAAETLSRYLNDVDPADRETRLRLARAYSWAARWSQAEEQYRRVLAAGPDSGIRLELARMLASAGRYPDAIAEYRGVLADSPTRDARRELAGTLARAGRHDAALRELARLIDEREETRDVLELARVLALADRYGDAADVLERVTAGAPGDAGLRLRRARYLWWAGRLEEADAAITVLLERDPANGDAVALREEIRPGIDPSVALAREWVALDDTPLNRLRLARALVKAERPAEALEHYRAAMAAGSDRALDLEVVDVAEAADSLALGIAVLERHVGDGASPDPELLLRLARLHAWSEHPVAAARAYAAYLELRPADTDARFERAQQLAWQDSTHWAAARTELERVVATDSLHAPALKLLGDLSRWQGDASGALAWYRRAADVDPELDGLDEGVRLALALKEAEAIPQDATRVAWAVGVDAFTDSQGFDWVTTRALYHWQVGGSTLSVTVGQGYSAGRTLLGAPLSSLGFSGGVAARFPLGPRWSGLAEAGASSYQDADPFLTWGAGVEYQDSLSSATVRYRREPGVREAATMAALRAGTVLDRVQVTGRRRTGAWESTADLQLQRFGADAGDATRFAGMARADRHVGHGLTVGAMIRAIAADGSAPVLSDEGPLYWAPNHYIAPALTFGYGRPLGAGWSLLLRAAPGYAWIDEREGSLLRYRDGETPILEAGATVGYRRGPWTVDVSGDWGGNVQADGYGAAAFSIQVSRSGGAR